MANENEEVIIDSENTNEEETAEVVETKEEGAEGKKEAKPQETPEAKRSRLQRQLAQHDKKFGFKNEVKETKTESKAESKSDDLDYSEKAYLKSYLDIKGPDELNLAKSWKQRTGDSLDTMVEDEIFLAKLGKLREAKASADAIPKGKTRGATPAQNDEAYWTAKIESGQAKLADIEDVAMRRKVLNSRIEKEKSGSKFAPQGIVMT